MEQVSWILWLILGVILMVAESLSFGFVLFWFGLGALAAAIVGYLGGGFGWQFMAFGVVSVALTAMSRTIFSSYFARGGGHTLKMGVESMPGQVGTVTAASKGALNEAAVKVFGSIWTAYPSDGETVFNDGEKVQVVEVRGSSIYVRRVADELPEWRQEQK
jgi:membrane protein implicated in regulation of membrane protease activity